MNQMQEALETLVATIKDSEEYQRYIKAKEEICKYPLLKAKADELRKRNYDLQNSGADIFVETDKLWKEYTKEIENSIIREYLSAETGFCRCIQQVNLMLMEEMDFDADFLLEKENV